MADTLNKSMTAEGSPVYRRLSQQEFNDIAGRILYEDNHLLVVEKPANLPVQADASGDADMLTLLKAYIKEKYPL